MADAISEKFGPKPKWQRREPGSSPQAAPGPGALPQPRTELTCDVEDVVGDAGRCHRALGGLSLQNGHHGLQLVQGPCQAGLAHQLLAHHLQREQAVTEQEQPRESPAGSVLRDIFTLEVPCALSGPGEGIEPALLTLRVASNFLVSPRLFHDIPRASVQAGRGCFWAGKRNKGRKLLPREALAAPPLELFNPGWTVLGAA